MNHDTIQKTLQYKLESFTRPLALRGDDGTFTETVRDAAVALAARHEVALNKLPGVMMTIVELIDGLSIDQRGKSLGLTDANDKQLFSPEFVVNAVHEQAEVTLMNIARLAARSVYKRCGYSGLTLLFDSTSTKAEFREYMSVALGIDECVYQTALDEWMGGKSAVEIASYLAKLFIAHVMRRQQVLLLYKVEGVDGATYPHSVHVAVIDNEASNPAALREFDNRRIVSHALCRMVNTVAQTAAQSNEPRALPTIAQGSRGRGRGRRRGLAADEVDMRCAVAMYDSRQQPHLTFQQLPRRSIRPLFHNGVNYRCQFYLGSQWRRHLQWSCQPILIVLVALVESKREGIFSIATNLMYAYSYQSAIKRFTQNSHCTVLLHCDYQILASSRNHRNTSTLYI